MTKITQTNGNSKNGIKGSRLSVWNANGELVDRFTVPSQDAQRYCRKHPGGRFAKRLAAAVAEANS